MNIRVLRRGLVAVTTAVALLGGAAAVAAAEPAGEVRWYGDASSATGAALSQGQCDLNADGYDDLVVGAWFWDKAPTNNIGATYVLFGDAQVSGGDLQSPGDAGAARIDGPSVANAFTGFSVACLGDVDADGIDDLGISYYVAEKVYVVLGAEDFGSVDLTNLGERGYEVQGDETNALDYNVGYSMSPVGDYDDDGIDDWAVAGVVADTRGRTNNGRVWIVAGKQDVADIDLIEPEEGEVLATIDGAMNEERLGSISLAGDVDGDGIDDFVLGSYTSTPWGPSVAVPGQAYVVFGQSGAEVDLANPGTSGFAIRGPERGRDRLGISVSGAGDVDGDGLDDLLVGADGVYNAATGERPGSAWVIWGSASTSTVYTDPAGDPTVWTCGAETTSPGTGDCDEGTVQDRGYVILGQDTSPGTASESTGYSVAGSDDVDGDGVPDLVIGAYGYDPADPAAPETTMSGAGAVFVVYGKADTETQDLAALTPELGYRVDGLAAGDRFGRQVSAPGDLDGNGAPDVVGAGDFAQRPLPPGTPRSQAGEVVLLLHDVPITAQCAADRFADVPVDHPFAEDICWMAVEGISTGWAGSPLPTYRPAAAVSRQAMAAFMYRLAGSPELTVPGTATFSDVGTGHPFFAEVEWMAAEGISTGYEGGTFRPAASVTRQAMSAFLHRLADGPGVGLGA